MGERERVSGDKELLPRESRGAMEMPPLALGVRRSLPIWLGAVSATEECGEQGKREQGGQFLTESRIPPSMFETWNIQGLHINY